MINELTQNQIDLFPKYVKKWIDIGLNTEPTDMIESVKFIKDAYKKVNIPVPKYFIGPVSNPYEAAVAEAIIGYHVKNKTEFKSSADLNTTVLKQVDDFINDESDLKINNISISNQIYGNQEYWLSYYDYFQNECSLDLNIIDPLIGLSKVCGWWTPLSNVVIIQHRPEEIHRDNEGRLHNENGPAVKFRGKNSTSDVYSVHGVRVTKNVINRNYTIEDIDKETNAEVRRVMINLYGESNYIIDSNATVVHTDDFGTLYRKEIPNDEPLMMVKVVNSTQEPDGSFKDYWIRVDGNAYGGLKTARAAVASTWRNNDEQRSLIFENPEDYDPDIET